MYGDQVYIIVTIPGSKQTMPYHDRIITEPEAMKLWRHYNRKSRDHE